ncbi:hypothetical protein K1719_033175 [Acacia pycnantha]|nr:hypothetical protein K1719_033175 [Acacia pycnantha]
MNSGSSFPPASALKLYCLNMLAFATHSMILINRFYSHWYRVNHVANLTYLETTLRYFSCLTAGDSIMVAYNNKKYYIDIIETKPTNAINIIEIDCEVDFAPPLDYKEPEKYTAPLSASKASKKGT